MLEALKTITTLVCMSYQLLGIRGENVRLVDGHTPFEGRVEVFYNYTWSAICSDGWDFMVAEVACRTLGFPGAMHINSAFGNDHSVLLVNITCNGNESTIMNCSYSVMDGSQCSTSHAGVYCNSTLGSCTGTLNKTKGWLFSPNFPGNYLNNRNCRWTVQVPSDFVIEVTLRMLRLNDGDQVSFYNISGLPQNHTVILSNDNSTLNNRVMEYVIGTTVNNTLLLTFTSNNYDNSLGFVLYYEGENVRLVDGHTPFEGRVEVFYNDTWSAICSDGWDFMVAEVACRTLGFPGAMQINSAFDNDHSVLLVNITCNGNETTIMNCSYSVMNGSRCSTSHAGVYCNYPGFTGCFADGDQPYIGGDPIKQINRIHNCIKAVAGKISHMLLLETNLNVAVVKNCRGITIL
ncbi:scavenger receptor cysteine-rich domain-containing protein DMBT1-like [Saccoglossus kowalevskii]